MREKPWVDALAALSYVAHQCRHRVSTAASELCSSYNRASGPDMLNPPFTAQQNTRAREPG